MHVDVAVIGLGAMGSAALWRLAARGAAVAGFEQFTPGHDRGSSHGESRAIRTAYFEGAQYVPLVRRSFALWRELERESGTPLLTARGALMIGPPSGELIAGVLASAAAHELAHEVLDAAQMRRRYPQHRLLADEVAVFEEAAGVLQPEGAILAMVARAERLGARVHRHAAVTGLDVDGGEVRLRVGDELHRARHAIVAAGPWLGRFLPSSALPLRVERQVLAWFPVHQPARYAPERFPVFACETAPGRLRYGFPTLDGKTIKLAVHHEGEATDPETIDRAIRARDLEPLAAFIRERLPGVEPATARGRVCMYTNTPDEHFIVGSPPGMPAVTVVSACSGHGFKFAPIIGDAVADLALDGATAQPIDLFSPARFVPVAPSRNVGA